MALSSKQRPASASLVRSYAREVQLYCFEFTGASTPADLVQDEAIVSLPTRDSAGLYSVAVSHRFKRIYGFANCEKGTVGWRAQITDVVDGGAAANSFKVRVANNADPSAAADPDAKVQVFLYLVTADSA